ncbi:MAG: leucine-rich repeat protein [Clostridia bacterium]|nr:leucine-rich repeat protein [Clostridia bacterium]
MSKFKLKSLVVLLFAILIVSAFMIGALASPEYRVTYYENATATTVVNTGDSVVLPTPNAHSGAETYGWLSADGALYQGGDTVQISGNTVFYRAFGSQVSSLEELKNAISAGHNYIKLGCDISANETLTINNGLFAIDTNGYTLSLSTDGDGILANDARIMILGNGAVSHTFPDADPYFILNSFIVMEGSTTCEHMSVIVGKDATLSTNVGLLTTSENISRFDGALSVKLYGNVSCDRLVRSNGISNGTVEIFDTATLSTTSEFFFDDISNVVSSRHITLTIYGGKINLNSTNGIASSSDYSKYKTIILGGYFSKDITSFFSAKNYSFSFDNGVNMYRFSSCAHSGPVFGSVQADCEEEVTVEYKCQYCDSIYTKYYANGIGHTDTVSLHSPCITTEEETSPGYYRNKCTRCGDVRYTPFYPDPSKVYVTVWYVDDDGNNVRIRVPSEELYTFDGTYLKSFGTEYIQDEYGAKQENIYYMEVPLGTTRVYGDYKHEAGSGVFYRNDHIKELVLPESLIDVDKYAFGEMTALEKLVGVEHITGSVGEYAFAQRDGKLVFDHMTINATKIEKYAFHNIRMISITFGKNLNYIREAAFGLSDGIETIVEEVFVYDNLSDGIKVSSALGGKYNGTNQQFGNLEIVYTNHTYDSVTVAPTCSSAGYDRHTCVRCHYYYDDAPVDPLAHNYVNILVPSTCLTYGYTANVCTECEHEEEGSRIQNMGTDKNNHNFTFGEKIVCKGYICEVSYYTLSTCECGAVEADTEENRSEVYPPANGGIHDWDVENEVITVTPTCGDYGTSIQTCLTCGKEKKISIAPNPDEHNWTNDPIVEAAPTCKNSGTLVYKCAVCSAERRTYPSPDPKNHVWDEGRVLKQPTTEEIGKMFYSCTLCTATFTEGIPKLAKDTSFPTWAIVLIVVVSVLLLAGVILALYFTIFKKKRASAGYKYKFNTLGR